MPQVTALLQQMRLGGVDSTCDLLPLIYDQLHRIAISQMSREKPGHTLQPTALVNEAWLRILEERNSSSWESRHSFYASVAEIMRHILVDAARRKSAVKHGGLFSRKDLHEVDVAVPGPAREIIAVSEALELLEQEDSLAAELVKLHYFAGLSMEEAADLLKMSRASAYRIWTFARTFLQDALRD